jgi:predicted SnoaL-like aldol condensation-catalyzing enzyme
VTQQLVHEDYKQHNPLVGDGRQSIVDFGELMAKLATKGWNNGGKVPEAELRYKHILVDGDFITVHVHAIRWPGDRGTNVIDIFRFQNGLFCEHWDAITEVLPDSEIKNSNGLF